jgi:hypothetical protein
LSDDGVVGPLTWGALDKLAGTPVVPAPGPDQHAGASRPDAAELAAIRRELNPASVGAGGVARAWDGKGNSAAAQANRAALRTGLTAALTAHLTRVMPRMHQTAAARQMPLSSFEGPGRQAKRVVDAQFGSLASAAALTAPQQAAHAAFNFTAGVNLLDATDPAVRRPDPDDLASWIAETDAAASAAQTLHGFDKGRSTEERTFLGREVLGPFVAAHRADLVEYDRFGFAYAEPGPRVLIGPAVIGTPAHPDVPPLTGGPSPAERHRRWTMWRTLVHEYIHTLEHPAFTQARQGRRVMFEGFCELFARDVLLVQIPIAKADSDPALRAGVEGTDPLGGLFPGFAADMVPDYDAGKYADYVSHAENILGALGGGGAAAVRAAFFQGHVELIGLTKSGATAAPADHARDDLVTVPSSVRSVFALSVMTAAPEAAILGANPGLTHAGRLPPRVHVPGCRYHSVVAAEERRPGGAVAGRKVETMTEIARQHGVTGADLVRANPGRESKPLKQGDQVLIPAH